MVKFYFKIIKYIAWGKSEFIKLILIMFINRIWPNWSVLYSFDNRINPEHITFISLIKCVQSLHKENRGNIENNRTKDIISVQMLHKLIISWREEVYDLLIFADNEGGEIWASLRITSLEFTSDIKIPKNNFKNSYCLKSTKYIILALAKFC